MKLENVITHFRNSRLTNKLEWRLLGKHYDAFFGEGGKKRRRRMARLIAEGRLAPPPSESEAS